MIERTLRSDKQWERLLQRAAKLYVRGFNHSEISRKINVPLSSIRNPKQQRIFKKFVKQIICGNGDGYGG